MNLNNTKRVLKIGPGLGRDFIVGDIHGCFSDLEDVLAQAGFDKSVDRLFSVGDLIDRGPDSVAALRYLKEPWFFAVCGNHEDLFMQCFDLEGSLCHHIVLQNLRNGADWMLETPEEVLAEMLIAFKALPLAIELRGPYGAVGIVHADVPPNRTWAAACDYIERDSVYVLWNRTRQKEQVVEDVEGIDLVVLGHTPRSEPTLLGNVFNIDTGCVFRHVAHPAYLNAGLTLLELTPAIRYGVVPTCTPGNRVIQFSEPTFESA